MVSLPLHDRTKRFVVGCDSTELNANEHNNGLASDATPINNNDERKRQQPATTGSELFRVHRSSGRTFVLVAPLSGRLNSVASSTFLQDKSKAERIL